MLPHKLKFRLILAETKIAEKSEKDTAKKVFKHGSKWSKNNV